MGLYVRRDEVVGEKLERSLRIDLAESMDDARLYHEQAVTGGV